MALRSAESAMSMRATVFAPRLPGANQSRAGGRFIIKPNMKYKYNNGEKNPNKTKTKTGQADEKQIFR